MQALNYEALTSSWRAVGGREDVATNRPWTLTADSKLAQFELELEPGMESRRSALATVVAFVDSLTGSAATFTIYHLVERPIKRVARHIAYSGHWGY
jgi:hypothetical protein